MRTLLCMALLCVAGVAFAQTPPPDIRYIEYFIDTDRGYGSGQRIAFTPGPEVNDLNFTIPLAGIDPGFHRLYIRARNANDVWSAFTTSVFYKENITPATPLPNIERIEYFIDADPGYGKGEPIAFTPGAEVNDISVIIPLDGVPDGFHRLYIRAKDVNDVWSALTTSVFYKENLTVSTPLANIVYVEYFIGNRDPGVGEGTKLSFTPGIEVNNINVIVDLSSTEIPEGTHKLYFRGRDANGTWSHLYSTEFHKCNGPVPVLNAPAEITPAGFSLSWSEALGAAYYELDISTDNFATFVPGYERKNEPTTSTVIANLSPGTTYQVRVRGYGNCSSVASNIQTVPTLVTPPAQPSGLSITGVTGSSLALAWTQPDPNPTGYLVLRKAGGEPDFVPVVNTIYNTGAEVAPGVIVAYSGSFPMPVQQGLTPGTRYYYAVYAYNQEGELVSYADGNPLRGDVSTTAQCQLPVPDFDVQLACATQPVQFINKSTSVLADAEFRWTFAPGIVVEQGAGNASHSYTNAGVYDVELRILQSGVCKDSIMKQVQIRDLPIVLFSHGPAYVNMQTNFSVASGNIPPNAVYEWDFDDDGVTDIASGMGEASHVFTSTGTFPVAVTLSDNQGCSVRSQRDVVVTVPLAGSAAVPEFSSTIACQGMATSFTNLSQNVPGDATTEWDFDADGVVDSTVPGNVEYLYPSAGLFSCMLRITVPGTAPVSVIRVVEVRGLPTVPFLLSESSTNICQGSSVRLFPSTSSTAGMIFQWKIDDQPVEDSDLSSLTAMSTGVYSLDVSNACGTVRSSNTVSVLVSAPPEDRTIIANGLTELCEGETVILSVPGQIGVTYQWTRDGEVLDFAGSSVLLVSQAGRYAVSMTNSCGTTVASNQIPVILKSREPVRQSVRNDGPLEFCAPGKVILSVPAEAGANYTWRINNIITGTNSPMLEAMEAGTYSLTIFNECRSVQALNMVSVAVRDKPRPQNISSNMEPMVCRGQAVELAIPVEQDVSYSWARNGVAISGSESRLIVADPGVYAASMTNECGTRGTENIVEVTVIEPLTEVNIVTNKGTTFCVGESIQLSVPAQPSALYTWKRNGDVLDHGERSVYTTSSDGVFTVEMYNACFSKTASIELSHYPVPPPTIVQASLLDACDTERYLLHADGDFLRFQWFLGTSQIVGATDREYTPLLSAAYMVQAFDKNGCSSVSEPHPVVITPKRIPTISAEGNPDSLLTISDAGITYQWYVDNKFIVGANERLFKVLYNGAYKARVVYDDGCSAFTTTYSVQDPRYISYGRVAIDLGDSVILPEHHRLSVYPNPASSELTVFFPGTVNDYTRLRIYTQFGQDVFDTKITGTVLTLELGDLPAGVYLLEIDNTFQRLRTKFIKE